MSDDPPASGIKYPEEDDAVSQAKAIAGAALLLNRALIDLLIAKGLITKEELDAASQDVQTQVLAAKLDRLDHLFPDP